MSGPLAGLAAGRVVVRLPNWLGDAMHALPALDEIRRQAPGARLEALARPGIAQVLAACEGVAEVVHVGGASSLGGVAADRALYRGAAAAVLLPNSFAAALPPWLARVPLRLGADRDGRGWLLTHAVAPPRAVHQAGYYLGLLGAEARPAGAGGLRLGAAAGDRGRRLAPAGPYAVLAPGAAFGTAKQWGGERFAELGRLLHAAGLEVVVVGTAGERALGAAVAGGSRGISLAGRTDGAELCGLLAGAAVVVANDSGALHLAAALGAPVVGLFGATDPRATGPVATGPIAGKARVLYHPVPCSPCGLRVCNRPRHECMEALPPAEVVAAALAAAGSASPSGVGG